MINLLDYIDEYVELELDNGKVFLGFVDDVCEAADNDEGTPETNQDGICLRTEESGGLFAFQSEIKSIKILPNDGDTPIGRIK